MTASRNDCQNAMLLKRIQKLYKCFLSACISLSSVFLFLLHISVHINSKLVMSYECSYVFFVYTFRARFKILMPLFQFSYWKVCLLPYLVYFESMNWCFLTDLETFSHFCLKVNTFSLTTFTLLYRSK